MRTKPLHKLEPQGVIRPTLKSEELFLLMSNGSMRQFKVKRKLRSSIINPFGYFKIHGFHSNPLFDFKDCEHSFKNIHISAASHPRAHNLLSNQSAEIALFPDDQIFKLSYMNIHEFLMRTVEIK